MKNTLLAVAMAAVAGLTSLASRANAAVGDSFTFNMVRPASATCLPSDTRGRVTISDLGSVQNMHLEVSKLPPNTSFTVFLTQHATRPFGLSWYQGEVQTGTDGRGTADFTGIFSDETFILSDARSR